MSLNNKLIISLNTDHGTGGSYKSLLPVLEELKNQGAKILAITPRHGNFTRKLCESGIDFVIVPTLSLNVFPERNNIASYCLYIPRLIKRVIFQLVAFIHILYIIIRHKPDLIHTNNSLTNVGADLGRLMRIPHVYHIREYGVEDFGWHRFPSEQYFLKQLDYSHVIAITSGIYDKFRVKRGRIIYNGICHKTSYKENVHTGDYFLYVGTLSENKGVNQLLHAFSIFTAQNSLKTKLILLGEAKDSDYNIKLTKLIHNLGLDNRVELKGYVDDVTFYMRNAQAVVVPSLFEGFGRTVAEAMFSNCLVIGHDTAGIKEQFDLGAYISNNEIGLRYNTVKELADRLITAYNMDTTTRSTILKQAHEVVNKLYTIESCTTKTCEYLDYILTLHN